MIYACWVFHIFLYVLGKSLFFQIFPSDNIAEHHTSRGALEISATMLDKWICAFGMRHKLWQFQDQ